jgi:hypothetical protein
MDQIQTQNIKQATDQWAESTSQSFRVLAERRVSLHESNLRFAQNFFQSWIEQVHNQAQGTREATQNLQEQVQRQREAFEALSQEGTNAYSELLNSTISFYQEALNTASQTAQRNMQNAAFATQQGLQAGIQAVSQTAQQDIQAANQTSQQAAQASVQIAQQGVELVNQNAQEGARASEQFAREGALAAQKVATGVPIQDYDALNVGAIVEQLDNLSADELQRVRAYEQQNKNRDTLLEQIDRKMRVATEVPIHYYDSLNVGEIVEQLDNLSADELQAARAHEQQNKNRDTLLEQIDRKINATA